MSIQCNKTGEVHVTSAMKVMHSSNRLFMLSGIELRSKIVENRKAPRRFIVFERKVANNRQGDTMGSVITGRAEQPPTYSCRNRDKAQKAKSVQMKYHTKPHYIANSDEILCSAKLHS
jgi:hypothetical protein